MKMTDIRMDWTDTGAIVSITSTRVESIACPRCEVAVMAGAGEHRCGDKVLKPKNAKGALGERRSTVACK